MNNKYIKLVMLGEGRVGKTSLTLRFCKSEFDDAQESTINASYLEKQITLQNNQQCQLAIWDTAGQEKFNALAPMYYRDALGAIIVYDITYRESFNRVDKWYHELKEFADKNIVICIAGNKADCGDQMRQIPKQEAEQYAKGLGAFHFNTSAKANMNVDELFQHITTQILQNQQSKQKGKGKKGKKPLVESPQDFQEEQFSQPPPERPSHKLKSKQKSEKEKKGDKGGCC